MEDSYIALDLETTGLSPENNHILEIGALKVEHGKVVDTYETFVQCPEPIDVKIRHLTGITDEMAASGQTEEAAICDLLEFCGQNVLLGHNILFDYKFVKAAVRRCRRSYEAKLIDTLKIARKLLPDVEKKSLEYLCGYFHINVKTSHRALADAKAAMELYHILWERSKNNEKLFAPQRAVVKFAKKEPVTDAQKRYLLALLSYHRLTLDVPIESLSKSEASKKIDGIIRDYGKISRY